MEFDVTVIGSGPGGYIAAIRAAQLGFKTAIVEKYPVLGGTCTNVGCIPSKAMLDSSEHFYNAQKHFAKHGIAFKDLKADLAAMVKRKDAVVKANNDGIQFLMKKNKVTVFHGVASFNDARSITIDQGKEKTTVNPKYIIIATGSKPATIPGVEIDKKRIITSTEALNLKKIPKSMVVIGGGYIGLEMGSVFARLGTKVQIIEYMNRIIPGMDAELSKEMMKILKKQGLEIYTGQQVKSATNNGKSVTVEAKNGKGESMEFKCEYCLVAVGRKPYTAGLNLEKAGLKTDEKGRIPVNDHLETAVKGIFAIGDVVRGAMLAHKAEEEGIYVAEYLAGKKPHINYNLIPGVVYTWPEVAGVGYTEEQLQEKKIPYKKGKFPFLASGRARASMDTEGFVKVLAHQETDEILGVHIIGARAADLISEAVVAMEFKASAEDIGMVCHPHPTFSEALKEACLAATENRALNL